MNTVIQMIILVGISNTQLEAPQSEEINISSQKENIEYLVDVKEATSLLR